MAANMHACAGALKEKVSLSVAKSHKSQDCSAAPATASARNTTKNNTFALAKFKNNA